MPTTSSLDESCGINSSINAFRAACIENKSGLFLKQIPWLREESDERHSRPQVNETYYTDKRT
jgi:hypothetical protein